VAVSSMNFGSGFLDDEEVACLRRAAEILGVEVEEATPKNFLCKYRRHHDAEPYLDFYMFTSFADGRVKNQYSNQPGAGLVKDTAKIVRMWCPNCGRRWDAFEDTSWRG
jgi:hypothetical protein